MLLVIIHPEMCLQYRVVRRVSARCLLQQQLPVGSSSMAAYKSALTHTARTLDTNSFMNLMAC